MSVKHTSTCPSQAELNSAPPPTAAPPVVVLVAPPAAPAGAPAPPVRAPPAAGAPFPVALPPAPPAGSPAFPVDWSFPNPSNSSQRVQVYTRSVYGMYRYLGELARMRDEGLVSKIKETYEGGVFNSNTTNEMLVLNHNNDFNSCWTSIFYEASRWCVPSEARDTKHVFNILHLLFRLYTQPSNQTVTPTVRTIGGS